MSVTAMPKTAPNEAAPEGEEEKAPRSKKKLLMILVLVLVIGGAGYWFFLRPTPPEPPPKPGEVVALDPIQINLAQEHYLRVGIALQLTEAATEADGSKALDATIATFSGQPISKLSDAKQREALKKKLEHELEELYEHEVMGVYFTEFVTQ